MLVLSRKLNESVIVGGDIRVTVAGIRGGQVRLAIEAPDRVGIYREELCLCVPADATGGPSPRPGSRSVFPPTESTAG